METDGQRKLGRLVNHSIPGTTYPKVVEVGKTPHVCLFASRDLEMGEQITYNYGVSLPFDDLVRISISFGKIYGNLRIFYSML
jgi:SET domain-containing protein